MLFWPNHHSAETDIGENFDDSDRWQAGGRFGIETVKMAAGSLEKQSGVKTGLAVVIVGDDPASHAYVNSKSKMAKECGFKSVQCTLPAETKQKKLVAIVAFLDDDASIGGHPSAAAAPESAEQRANHPVDAAAAGCRRPARRQRRQARDRMPREVWCPARRPALWSSCAARMARICQVSTPSSSAGRPPDTDLLRHEVTQGEFTLPF